MSSKNASGKNEIFISIIMLNAVYWAKGALLGLELLLGKRTMGVGASVGIRACTEIRDLAEELEGTWQEKRALLR